MNLQSDTIGKLMPALLTAQTEFAPAVKNATNPAFKSKYVDLEGVLDAVTPALLKNRIVLVQQTDFEDGVTVLVTRLIHETGEWLGSRYPLRPAQQTPQGEGSAMTYARRYTAMAICGIAPEDDDGNAASQKPAPRPAPKPAEPEATPEVVQDFEHDIDQAQTAEQLNAVGAKLASSNVGSTAKVALRKRFTDRMAELKAAA